MNNLVQVLESYVSNGNKEEFEKKVLSLEPTKYSKRIVKLIISRKCSVDEYRKHLNDIKRQVNTKIEIINPTKLDELFRDHEGFIKEIYVDETLSCVEAIKKKYSGLYKQIMSIKLPQKVTPKHYKFNKVLGVKYLCEMMDKSDDPKRTIKEFLLLSNIDNYFVKFYYDKSYQMFYIGISFQIILLVFYVLYKIYIFSVFMYRFYIKENKFSYTQLAYNIADVLFISLLFGSVVIGVVKKLFNYWLYLCINSIAAVILLAEGLFTLYRFFEISVAFIIYTMLLIYPLCIILLSLLCFIPCCYCAYFVKNLNKKNNNSV